MTEKVPPSDLLDTEACRRFQSAWWERQPQPLERFLPPENHPDYRATLEELVLLELELAHQFRTPAAADAPPAPPRVEAYLARFPCLNQPGIVPRLVAQEYLARQRYGDPPSPEEYRQRFPAVVLPSLEGIAGAPVATRSEVGPDTRWSFTPEAAGAGTPGQPQVAGYEVLGELGRGGMGVVYRARQVGLKRLVALKMILAGSHAGPEHLARFKTEAEAVARLQHPNVVQIYEIGTHEGRPYLALEFCPGGSLDKKLNRTPLPPEEAAALVETLARAVQAAHQAGVVHRDLKPANVLLTGGPDTPVGKYTPKIADFGLAKKLDEAAGQTQSGAVMGTPSYMAPEQAAGKSKDIGPACDVYALGAILYECLTGRPPFKAATEFDTLSQVLTQEPVPVRQLQPRVPRDLETICLKCLRKEPAQRYASAAALAEDLERWLAGAPIRARPVSVWRRLGYWARRHPATAALAAVSLLAVLAVGFAAAEFFYRGRLQALNDRLQTEKAEADRQRQAAQQAEAEAQRQRAEADKQRARARRLQYVADMGLAQRAWEEKDIGRLRDLLESHRPGPAGGEDLRGFEWHYLRRFCPEARLTLRGHTGWVVGVSWSPDGRRLASASADQTAKVWGVADGRAVRTLEVSPGWAVRAVAFSPDGKRLASAAGETVKVWDAATGQEILTLWGGAPLGIGINSLAFSPDGKRLAGASDNQTVRVWDAQTGKETLTLKGHRGGVNSVAFSPDGQRLASASRDETVRLWDAQTGQEERTLRHKSIVEGVSWSPNGKRLASVCSLETMVRVWDAQTGQEVLQLQGHKQPVKGVCWSPDGDHLASASSDWTIKVWDARSGREALTLQGHTDEVRSVCFSPDGQRLASASQDGTLKVWEANIKPEALSLRGHALFVEGVAFNPDGQRLASASQDKTVKVWDVRTGQETLTLQGHTGIVTSVCFSADGLRLASASGVVGEGEVKVWEAQTGQLALSLNGHTDWVRSVCFSPNGTRLASASWDRTIKVWDARMGQELLSLKGHTDSVWGVCFSPDGTRLASAGGGPASRPGEVKVWDAQTGQQALALKGHTGWVFSVCWSPDGTRLASASSDQTVRVWEADTGQEALTLRGHTGNVLAVAWSPDGRRLASASDDQTVKLWDPDSGREALTLKGHTEAVTSVCFSPDGTRLASASHDRTVRIWDATPLPVDAATQPGGRVP